MSAAMTIFETAGSISLLAPKGAARDRSVLATIREMIGGLDSLTMAGQRHMMDKVVTALRNHVAQAPRTTSERNRRAVVDHLGMLAPTEARGLSTRLAPGPSIHAGA
jgi:hypothetical protein